MPFSVKLGTKFQIFTKNFVLHHFTLPSCICMSNLGTNTLNRIQVLQEKLVWIIGFRANICDVGELYKNDKTHKNKIPDYIKILNCLFLLDRLTNSLITPFQNYFIESENLNQYSTRHVKQNPVILMQRNSNFYGIKWIQHQAATAWNKLQNEVNHDVLQDLRSKTREFFTNKILNIY